MKNILLSMLGIALVFISACSSPPESKPSELLDLLPAQVLGFISADLQEQQTRNFIHSEAYRAYIENLKSSFALSLKNSDDHSREVIGNLDVYWDVLQSLKLLPSGQEDDLPFGGVLFFGVAGKQRPVDFAGYYDTTAVIDARDLITATQEILKQAKIEYAEIPSTAYRGIVIRPFAGLTTTNVLSEVYRDQLKIEEFFLAANHSRLVVATAKDLLDRGFGNAAQESKGLIESADYKRVIAEASAGQPVMMVGMIDLEGIQKSRQPNSTDTQDLPTSIPFSVVGLTARIEQDIISLNAATLVKSQTPEVKKVESIFDSPPPAEIFNALPGSLTFGIVVDVAPIQRAVAEFVKDAPPQAIELLKGMQTISLWVQNPEFASLYPDFILTARSADAKGSYDSLIRLSSEAFPPGLTWKDIKLAGLDGKILTTPLGISIRLAHSSDTVVLSNSEKLASDQLSANRDNQSGSAKLIGAIKSANPKARGWLFINYPKFAELMKSTLQNAAAFSGQAAPSLQQSFDQMKYMGKVAIALGYDHGVVRLSYSQDLDSK